MLGRVNHIAIAVPDLAAAAASYRDPLGAAQVRAGDHRIPVAQHLQVPGGAQRGLDGIRDGALVAGDGGDVDELPGELGGGCGGVERGHGASLPSR